MSNWRKAHNHLNNKFHMLTVIERMPNDRHGKTMWRCKCDCGRESIARGQELLRGETTSCGCVRSMINKISNFSSHPSDDKEDEKFIFYNIVCGENRKNYIARCKNCNYEKAFRKCRVYGLEKHKCQKTTD